MDAIDQALIARLQVNARESLSSLARELGISRSTLKDRMDRLERREIIEGYTIRLNRGVLGSRIKAQILLNLDQKQNASVAQALSKLIEVQSVYAVSGNYDLLVNVETADTETLDAVVDAIAALEGVRHTQTLILFSSKFERHTT